MIQYDLTGMSFLGSMQVCKENLEQVLRKRQEMRSQGAAMLAHFDANQGTSDTGLGKQYSRKEFDLYVFEHDLNNGLFHAKASCELIDSGLTGLLSPDHQIRMRQFTQNGEIFHYEGSLVSEIPLTFEGTYKIPARSKMLWGTWSMKRK